MDNPEKQATLRTQDRTKTNKTNNIAQKTIMMSITAIPSISTKLATTIHLKSLNT
jgi:hypothetical protein